MPSLFTMDGVAQVATGTGFSPCWKAAAPARRGRYAAEDGQIRAYVTESPNVNGDNQRPLARGRR